MERRVALAAGAVVLALGVFAAVRGAQMAALHRRVAERWRPIEVMHRMRAELVPRLEDAALRAGAEGSFRPTTGAVPSLPPVSGAALLDDPAAFQRWDEEQRDLAGRMMEMCQMIVASPQAEQDPLVRGLLDRLAASERPGRAAEDALAEAVAAYTHAREGWVGDGLARLMGLSRRAVRVSGAMVFASPDLLARCPLVN